MSRAPVGSRPKHITMRYCPERNGTICGTFRLGDNEYRYKAMYLRAFRTMSLTEVEVEIEPRKGKSFWRHLRSDQGSRMRLYLVRRLNREIAPGRNFHRLTQNPPVRPARVGG